MILYPYYHCLDDCTDIAFIGVHGRTRNPSKTTRTRDIPAPVVTSGIEAIAPVNLVLQPHHRLADCDYGWWGKKGLFTRQPRPIPERCLATGD